MTIERAKPRLLDDFLEELEQVSSLDELALPIATPIASGEELAEAPSLRARLLDATTRVHRFDDFETRIAELGDIDVEAVRELLLALDRPDGSAWEASLVPGVTLVNFVGGPKVQPAITGFVRVAPGVTFPHHEHVGDEVSLILQGTCTGSDGVRYLAGDEIPMKAGSAHSFTVPSDAPPLVFLTVVSQGISVGGQFIGPDDTRM